MRQVVSLEQTVRQVISPLSFSTKSTVHLFVHFSSYRSSAEVKMSLIPIFEDSIWGLAPRRGWDFFDLDPWMGHRSSLRSLDNLFRDLDRMRSSVDQQMQVRANKDNYQVALDVHGYKPEELQVSVDNNCLTMSGKHEERSKDGRNFVSRQFTRSFALPESVDVQQLKSSLAADGRTLRIEAPVKQQALEGAPKEVPIAVQFKNK